MGDEGNAAVDDDGDAVFTALLVAQRLSVCARGQSDGRVPQGKVHFVVAVNVYSSRTGQGKGINTYEIPVV